jgi:adenylate cyclase
MTEEIGLALSKVPGLELVGRTSAFQFRDQARDLRDIGAELGATHLVEGSVQKSGSIVRVRARLVRADSGVEVWNDGYNFEMTDVFAVQEEMARAVTSSLLGPLGLKESGSLVASRAIEGDDYEEYLRAKNLFHSRGLDAIRQARDLLEGVVGRNPDFAPAWALMAQAYHFIPNFDPAWFSGDFDGLHASVSSSMPRAVEAANKAIMLDPELADGYYSLALALEEQGNLTKADDLYRQALALNEHDPDVLHLYSRLLAKVGYLDQAWSMRERLLKVDPFVPVYRSVSAFVLWVKGRDAEAIAMADDLPPSQRGYTLSRILASNGHYAEAAEVIERDSEGLYLPGTAEQAARLLRAPTEVPAAQSLPKLGLLAFAYLYVGAPERALEPHEEGVAVGYSVSIFDAFLWHKSYATLRRSERFKAFLRNAGIVAYWDVHGWPEFCRRVGSDDFACQ